MAENDNRGPNDPTPFRRPPGGRKRREPPLIDATATPLPTQASEPAEPQGPVEETTAEAESRAGLDETVPHADRSVAAAASERTPASEGPQATSHGAPLHSASEGIDGLVPPTAEPPAEAEMAMNAPVAAIHPPAAETPADAPLAATEPAVHEPAVHESAAELASTAEHHEPAAAGALSAWAAGGQPGPDHAPNETPISPASAADIAARLDRVTPFGSEPRVAEEPAASMGAVPPPPQTRSGFSPLAVLFGLIALVLLGTVAWLLIANPERNTLRDLAATVETLQTRIATLEARPAPPDVSAKVAGLVSQVTTLNGATDSLSKQISDIRSKLGETAAAVAAAQAKLAEAGSAPAAGTAPPAGAAPAPAAAPVDLAPLEAKVSDLDSRLSALAAAPKPTIPPSVDLGPTLSRINDLDNRLTNVQASLGNLPKVDLKPLESATGALDARMTSLDGRVSGLGGRIDAIAKDVAVIDQQLSPPKAGDRVTEARAVGSAAESRAAPVAVVGQAVLRSLASGQPFGPELDALKALGTEDAVLAPLEPFAAKGAPTAADLKAQWDQLQGDVLAALHSKVSGSVLDRLAAGARSLVQIHPVGAVLGEDPSAVTARVDGDLKAGDLAAALAEWSKLPERGQALSQAWAAAVKARLAADAAAQGLIGKAIATLGQAKG